MQQIHIKINHLVQALFVSIGERKTQQNLGVAKRIMVYLLLLSVIFATVQFTDTAELKNRPAVVLFEELGNVVVAGITSNLKTLILTFFIGLFF